MTTINPKKLENSSNEDNGHHEDFRLFGLITFLIADGMTFAGLSLIHI